MGPQRQLQNSTGALGSRCYCLDMQTTSEIERWAVIGFSEKVFQVAQGEPYLPGGCCDKCSAAIRYVVTLKSTQGKIMSVGRDCAVTLEGGPELAAIRNAQRAWEAAEDERLYGAERRARKAAREAEEAAAKAYNETVFAWTMAGLRLVVNSDKCSMWQQDQAKGFLSSMERGWKADDISDDEKLKMLPSIMAATAPESTYVGTIGSKVEVKAVLEALIGIDGMYGTKYLHKFRTENGEIITWFATGYAGAAKKDEGRTHTIKGTVKKHEDYKRVKQTILTRCKLVVV